MSNSRAPNVTAVGSDSTRETDVPPFAIWRAQSDAGRRLSFPAARLTIPAGMIGDELAVYFENPARDALGYEHVGGCLRFLRGGVELFFDEKDRAFRKIPPKTVTFSYAEVVRVEYVDRWFRPKRLIFETSSPDKLTDFPGAAVGRVELMVVSGSRADAAKAPAMVEFRRSEAVLADSAGRVDEELGKYQSGL